MFLVGLGEELWKKFRPKYLESLGAGVAVVGLFGTAEDFFDAIYQYPGGWLADHLGRQRAFLMFLAAAAAGYLIYLFSPAWPYLSGQFGRLVTKSTEEDVEELIECGGSLYFWALASIFSMTIAFEPPRS